MAAAPAEEYLARPWPRERARHIEVGRTDVVWREATLKHRQILAGADFTVPSDVATTWSALTDYRALGPLTPGVTRVELLEETPTRRLVQVTIALRTLFGTRTLQLRYAIDQEPPRWVTFRLLENPFVDYRGRVELTAADGGTRLALATALHPRVAIPSWLLLWVERHVVLGGIRTWLTTPPIGATPRQAPA